MNSQTKIYNPFISNIIPKTPMNTIMPSTTINYNILLNNDIINSRLQRGGEMRKIGRILKAALK